MKEIHVLETVVNSANAEACSYAARFENVLRSRKVTVLSESDGEAEENVFPDPDVIVAFGGDGTILRAAHLAIRYDAPVVGINFGHLGFLAETAPEDPAELAEMILNGCGETETRMILEAAVNDGSPCYAINDVVVSRGGYARLISLHVSVNDEFAGHMQADGLVVATPTGSTGYSVSAGGPVVSPDVDCMTITPVCPHSLQQRPQVVAGETEITVRLGSDPLQAAVVQVDGQNITVLKENGKVSIRKSQKKIKLIRLHHINYFALVRTKLCEWGMIPEEEKKV